MDRQFVKVSASFCEVLIVSEGRAVAEGITIHLYSATVTNEHQARI